MKRFVLIWLVFLGMSHGALAQDDNPLKSVVFRQEKEYWERDKTLNKSLQDYLKLVQLANSIARNCSSIGFKAKEGSTERSTYLRWALVYYSLAANNAQLAIDKHESKSMARERDRACKQAAFMYRSLGKPKRIHDKRFIDVCGLTNGVDENSTTAPKDDSSNASNNDPLYVEEEFEKTLIGKRLFFKTPKQMFSMKVYEPFIISSEQAVMRGIGQSKFEEALKMIPEGQRKELTAEMKNKYARMHWYTFEGDLGGLIFFAEDMEGKDKKTLCEQSEKPSKVSFKTSVSGAEACFSNIYRHPVSGERLEAGSSFLQIKHKGELYAMLLMTGKNYNSAKHEKVLKAMARSLRMEGVTTLPTVKVQKCKDSAVMPLAKGIPVSWTIIDRSKKPVIIQQPKLARDAEIGGAVSNYYAAILTAVKGAKDIKQALTFSKELVVDKDLRQSLLTAGGFALEHRMKRVDFVPVEVEDYSEFQMDGALTSAAIFYLDALKGVSAGIGGLGKRINKQSMRLYWEIPVITIEGECIPQMICDNGKWRPDYKTLTYRELKKVKHELRSPNKDFMTVREVERDLDRYFRPALELAEEQEGAYASLMKRCDKSKEKLHTIDFPVNIDKCPQLENAIMQNQFETMVLERIRNVRKDEMTHWLKVLKPAEIQKHTRRIAELRAEIVIMKEELKKLIRLREGHLNQGQTSQANELKLRIQFLGEDIALLESFKRQSNEDLARVNSTDRETAMTAELKDLSAQMSNLKKQKASLKLQLATCVKEFDKFR